MANRKGRRRRNRQNLVPINPRTDSNSYSHSTAYHNNSYSHPTAYHNNSYIHPTAYNNNSYRHPPTYNSYYPIGYHNVYRRTASPLYGAYDFSSAPTTFSSSSLPSCPEVARQFSRTPMAPTVPVVTIHGVPSFGSEGARVGTAANPVEPSDDDVVYLYTVSGGQLIEVVDLGEDAEGRESNSSSRNFVLSNEQNSVPEVLSESTASVMTQLTGRDVEVVCVSNNITKDTTAKTTVKEVGKKRKRGDSLGEARCIVCHLNYEEVTEKKGELFTSRCGHLFCMDCLKHLIPYKCTVCKIKISHLWKIYL